MTVDVVILLVNSAGVVIVAIGLFATWRKNGKEAALRDNQRAQEQALRDQQIASNQTGILERLDDKETGLQAINKKAQDMKLHCAEISTALCGRVGNLECEIKEVKQAKRK